MRIFCHTNVHSLQNTVLWCHFFHNFREKPLLSSPYLVKKTSILPKLDYITGQTVKGMPFFLDSLFSYPYIAKNFKNTSTTSKTICFHVIFSIFLWKSPCCHAHIYPQIREFCQNYTILWAENVNRILFIPIF